MSPAGVEAAAPNAATAAPTASEQHEGTHLSPEQMKRAVALVRAIVPAGKVFPGGDAGTAVAAENLLGEFSSRLGRHFGGLVDTLDRLAIVRTGRRFYRLDPERQESVLRSWETDPVARWPLAALSFLVKSTHYDRPEVYRAMGCIYKKGGPAESVPWLRQVRTAADVDDGETVECDVVVIGTGAGGAVCGHELAARGLAVVFLEEGELHRRDSFTGSALKAHRDFYRGKAGITTVGNALAPIFMGRLVGGSTAINTGTCFRTPPWILDRWCETLGSDALSEAAMAPHFERVERQLTVETASPRYLGGVARVVARGCDALGWHHFPLRRNAPDCDGQGVCDFGCPTDARRSTNVSYIPPALTRGAMLHTGTRAERVLIENGRAVGVEARTRRGKLTVRSRAVVLSGGAVPTPLFLLGQGILNRSGQVGRNLSIHPATAVSALFDEKIVGYNAIPQGYGCDEFHQQGILLLGASAPLNIGALMFPFNGRRLTEAMEAFDRVASFGVMVEDDVRGRVRRTRSGAPLITYFLGRAEMKRLQVGMVRVMEIFHAAGAKTFFPMVLRDAIVKDAAGIEGFRRRTLHPWDLYLSSFHPLGTCRMGRDGAHSVVGLDHQAHDLPGLYIVDGSTVPGPPAVNPQLTIMAMADRAGGLIADQLV
jgi:choline dehydrogenase-like flavoprotein